MAKLEFKNGITSVILRVFIQDTTSTTGAGKTGLSSASGGLIISTIADNEATPTVYTAAGSTTETITTLGTFAAPTATKCRFKEVDATNHPGVYEIQIANARWAVSSARSIIITTQVTGGAVINSEIQLVAVDTQDTVRMGLTALPNAVAGANAGLPLGDASGRVDLSKINGDTLSPLAMVDYFAQAVRGTVQSYSSNLVTLESGASSVDNYYRGMTIYITSGPGARQYAEIVAYTGSTRVAQTVGPWQTNPTTSSTYMVLPIGAANVVSWYFGGVAAPSAAGYIGADVEQWKGATAPAMTGDAFARLGVAGAGLTALGDTRIANLDATISSRTKPADTQAAVTLVTTTTNLTNAPTNGDLTAAMKASVNAEADTALLDVGLTATITGRIDAAITTRLAAAGYTTPPTVVAIRTEMDSNSTKLANLDAAVTTRMATFTYTTPPTAVVIADTTLRRDLSLVEVSATGDPLTQDSVYGAASMLVHKVGPPTGNSLPLYKSDGTTLLHTFTTTSDPAAEPITSKAP